MSVKMLQMGSLDVLEHHLRELLVRNLSISVGINLLDDLLNDFLIEVLAERKNFLDLLNGNGTTTVFVKHLESSLQLIVGQKVLLIECSDDELRVLDLTRSISIDLGEQLIDFSIRKITSEEFSISFLDLIFLELSITIQIHGSENFIDLLLLLLGEKLGGNKSVSGLLKL